MEQPKTKKIVLNQCYGGFGWSEEAKALKGLKGWEIVEKLGSEAASGKYAELVVVEIPAELKPFMVKRDYDGWQWVTYDMEDWFLEQIKTLTPENLEEFKSSVTRLHKLIEEEREKDYTYDQS